MYQPGTSLVWPCSVPIHFSCQGTCFCLHPPNPPSTLSLGSYSGFRSWGPWRPLISRSSILFSFASQLQAFSALWPSQHSARPLPPPSLGVLETLARLSYLGGVTELSEANWPVNQKKKKNGDTIKDSNLTKDSRPRDFPNPHFPFIQLYACGDLSQRKIRNQPCF